jgi:hypothetical protein
MQTATNETADRASIPDNPIAAFLQANNALATTANGYASGPDAEPDASTGSA